VEKKKKKPKKKATVNGVKSYEEKYTSKQASRIKSSKKGHRKILFRLNHNYDLKRVN